MLGFVLHSSCPPSPQLVLTRTLFRSANLLIVGFAELDVFKAARRDEVIVVTAALCCAAARVLQVREWFCYFWNSTFWSGLTGTLGNTLGENCTFLSEWPEADPTSCFVLPPPLLQAGLLGQPEHVQLLARLRLRPDRLPAPRHGGSQPLPHILPQSQGAAFWLSGRPL